MAIKCTSCNEKFPKEVGVCRTDEVLLEKQHGTANFCVKCKNCDRKGFITILPASTYKAFPNEDCMIKETIACFECRGLEILEVVMTDQFLVKVKDSATVFPDADFSDLWAEYDDATSDLATVDEQKFDIVKTKDK